jgi:hypothetical protein
VSLVLRDAPWPQTASILLTTTQASANSFTAFLTLADILTSME